MVSTLIRVYLRGRNRSRPPRRRGPLGPPRSRSLEPRLRATRNAPFARSAHSFRTDAAGRTDGAQALMIAAGRARGPSPLVPVERRVTRLWADQLDTRLPPGGGPQNGMSSPPPPLAVAPAFWPSKSEVSAGTSLC